MTHRWASAALGCAVLCGATFGGARADVAAPAPAAALVTADDWYHAALDARRAHPHPAYVAFAVHRKLQHGRTVDEADAKGWYRTTDARALLMGPADSDGRHDWTFGAPQPIAPEGNGSASAPSEAQGAGLDAVAAPAADATPMASIGHVVAHAKPLYSVAFAGSEPVDGHAARVLAFTPLVDADRDGLRKMWVDESTHDVLRVETEGWFSAKGRQAKVLWQTSYAVVGNYLVVTSLHGSGTFHFPLVTYSGTADWVYRDYRFPAALPAWYFGAPADLRAHAGDAEFPR